MDADKQEFLEAIGLPESGVDKLTRAAYHLLGLALISQLVKKKCVLRLKRGTKAPSSWNHPPDLKGFIRSCDHPR